MDSLALIISMCTIMWYLIDNLKENLWGHLTYSNYITIAVSAVGSFVLSFGYHLDLINALGYMTEVTVLGQAITALAMMGGSALVSEIIDMFRLRV